MGLTDTPGTPQVTTSKAYRRPRRRPAHLRTKTGCLTCRRRKKKCDETRSQCSNCTRQNIECIWQTSASRPIPRSGRQNTNSNEITEGAQDQVSACLTPTRLPKQSTEPAGSPQRHLHPLSYNELWIISKSRASQFSLAACTSTSSYTYSSAITPESRHLFHFLKCKFLPELIRPAADSEVITTLSRQTLTLALAQPFFMHALLACCGAEIPSHDPAVRELARFHYTQAVAALRRHINNRNIQSEWMVTMLTVMMLCIYERSKPERSSGVEIHLAGAARLIQLCSRGNPKEREASDLEKAMHRLVRESFIFHVATSLPFQDEHLHQLEIESAFCLAEEAVYPHFHTASSYHSDSPVLGFPPKLFRCIYMVYRLYQTSQWESVPLETFQNLDRDLLQWNNHITAPRFDTLLDRKSGPIVPNGSIVCSCPDIKNSSHPATLGPRLYILGCRILLHRMSSACTGEKPSLGRLLQDAITAVQQLQPKQDYFAEYYCWPLFTIGMSLKRPSDQNLLMSQVHAFWVATNNGTMRRLADKLLLYWQ